MFGDYDLQDLGQTVLTITGFIFRNAPAKLLADVWDAAEELALRVELHSAFVHGMLTRLNVPRSE